MPKDKKTMKKGLTADDLRKTIVNKILSKNKGLTLVENRHGAIQIKRDGDLLFSLRGNNKAIVTHPMFEGKGKKKKRIFKHPGSKWDHLSEVPFADLTLEMCQARVDDKKTVKEYFAQIYKGREKESGLFMKAEAAKKRAEKLKKDAKTAKKGAKTAKRVAKKTKKKAETTVKRSATKKKATKKVGKAAIKEVAEAIVAS